MINCIIPKIPLYVESAKAQRAKYFKLNSYKVFTESGKLKGKPLFKKYLIDKNKPATESNINDYAAFDETNKILLYQTKEGWIPILANETQVGKSKVEYINFNKIWSGGRFVIFYRNKVVNTIHEAAQSSISKMPKVPRELYPILIKIELHLPVQGNSNKDWKYETWDEFNITTIYHKVLVDMLKENGIIIDDDRMLCRTICTFVPLPSNSITPCAEITIEKLNDARVLNNPYFKEYYENFKSIIS